MTGQERKSSGLSPSELFRLDSACIPLRQVFDATPYLVGSCAVWADYRDVDVRIMLTDKPFDAIPRKVRLLLNLTTSEWLRAQTGLPVDFQLQRRKTANKLYGDKRRNPLGIRNIESFRGDAP
jgi:hypothetical protein